MVIQLFRRKFQNCESADADCLHHRRNLQGSDVYRNAMLPGNRREAGRLNRFRRKGISEIRMEAFRTTCSPPARTSLLAEGKISSRSTSMKTRCIEMPQRCQQS
jgi:hypothetical protein